MSSPSDPDPAEAAPKSWRRWLPLIVVAAVAGVIAIIAVVSGGDDDSKGESANTLGGSVAPGGSSATIDTSAEPVTTGALSTSASDTAGPTSSSASTNPPDSSAVTTIAPTSNGATTPPTSNDAATPPTSNGAAAPPATTAGPIDLGRAADFAVLGNTAVANTGKTTVIGQIGTSNGRATGWSAADNPTGLIIVDSQAAQQGQLAADAATSELDGLARTGLSAAGLGTQRIGPGTYSSASLDVSGTVTLDAGGDPNALFVFESASALTVAAASQIVLDGGAQACNVYWRTGSSATVGSDSTFVGTVIADESITVASGSDVVGRFIARNGAVTLDSDSIAIPSC